MNAVLEPAAIEFDCGGEEPDNVAVSSSSLIFTVDLSPIVALLDNQRCDALDSAIVESRKAEPREDFESVLTELGIQ